MKFLQLCNFRCFEYLEIDFKKDINLLIGDNASGKTSLIKACKYALSAFFSGFSDENTKWISPKSEDFRRIVVNGETIVNESPIEIDFEQEDDLFKNARGQNSLLKQSKKNSRALVTGIKSYRDNAKWLMEHQYKTVDGNVVCEYALPLFASFTTEDIHSKRKLDKKAFRMYAQKSSFGYIDCLDGDGLLEYWNERLLALKEAGKNEVELTVVHKAIVDALGAEGCNIIDDMDVRPIAKEVFYHFVDGREDVQLDMLSDGYRRLVNIVTDLAFRCVLLNKNIYGEESALRTKGVVLIDEIDMHLHPMLQAVVLKGLKRAFPQLQFIVTTHAPMVMSGVERNENNVVYKMEYDVNEKKYQVSEVQTYGLDASTIIELMWNMSPRDKNTDNKLKNLFDCIDNNKVSDAETMLAEMESEYHGQLPELKRARVMLDLNAMDYEEN